VEGVASGVPTRPQQAANRPCSNINGIYLYIYIHTISQGLLCLHGQDSKERERERRETGLKKSPNVAQDPGRESNPGRYEAYCLRGQCRAGQYVDIIAISLYETKRHLRFWIVILEVLSFPGFLVMSFSEFTRLF